ncbi:MAG TPA: hypothetical protein VE954_05755 [Oligoflexus sp.]|uniref:hypothetical protein n=1 Tax=Oligoflexus sp. TaxID=1971216 RepID=UPI002D5BF0D8|nr:hypothetical protein [Oligoflexus sp.]HYX32597.1 hypothetical protein [Oligoflexus sp.]
MSGTGSTYSSLDKPKSEKVTVSIREFARIVGVAHTVVIRAMKAGQRLQKSVTSQSGKPKIFLYEGCVEWHNNKDLAKERYSDESPVQTKGLDMGAEMEPTESNRKQRHYVALLAELEFLKEAGKLTTIDKFKTEAFTVSRTLRDNLLYIPNESSNEIKRLVSELLRNHFGEQKLNEAAKDIEAIALSFRVFQKASLTKALRAIVSDRFGTLKILDHEGVSTDEL